MTFWWWFESVILFGKLWHQKYKNILFCVSKIEHPIFIDILLPLKVIGDFHLLTFRKSCNTSVAFTTYHDNMFSVIKQEIRPLVHFHPKNLSKRQIFAYYLPFHLATHAIYVWHLQTVIIGLHNILWSQNKTYYNLFFFI